jgi:hypothetical protein
MCNEPVMFGGGMTMENASPGASGSASNSPASFQALDHRSAAAAGSYAPDGSVSAILSPRVEADW